MQRDSEKPTVIVAPGNCAPASVSPPTPGQRWGKFLIEKRLGEGGQAEVFQAFDQLGPTGQVALKVPRQPLSDAQIQKWVDREAGALVKLDHPQIVRVLDAGCVGSFPYIATQLVEGLPMNEHVRRTPPSLRQILDWMVHLADALDCAHIRGIVHRDLKPRNVILTPQGQPRLIDFGIASLVTPYQPEARTGISGTFAFMAPEQARGDPEADHRVDVFSLGGILKFLLTAEGPYGAENAGETAYHAAREGKVKFIRDTEGPRLRRALSRIANRALQPDPGRRYPNAAEMAKALRRLRLGRTAAAYAAAALGVLLACVFGWQVAKRQWEPQTTDHRPQTTDQRPAPSGDHGAPTTEHRPPKSVAATLELHFQRKAQVGSYQVVTADAVPLRTGDRIRIHASLSEPLHAYLFSASSNGATRLLHPPPAEKSSPVKEIHIPIRRDEWFELSPPTGTETILLLARREPLKDVEAFCYELLSFGPPPALDGLGLLVVDESTPRLVSPKKERPLGDKPVKVEKGFLDLLLKQVPQEWTVVRALAFPHHPAPEPPNKAPR